MADANDGVPASRADTGSDLGPTAADFRHLADAIPRLARIADGAGSILWHNRRWSDYTGTSFAEMQGRGWSKVHRPDHLFHVVERYTSAFARGETWGDTFPLRRRHDGTFRWFLSRAEPVRDASGAVARWFGTNTDLTGLWRECLHTRTPFHAEFRLRRRDGEWRHSEARPAPVMVADGTVREWVGVNSDITERRRGEDAMQEAKELAESANRAESQFIANMSHELRTPLSAVVGYSEMLAEKIEDLGQSHLLADLGKIESSARRLPGLINDVLDLSKIEAGRMTVDSVPFDVAAMVDEVVSATGALIARKGNRFALDLGGNLGLMRSDELKVRQCLMNLIGNAAKFAEGGLVTLRVRRDGPERLLFEVADTGFSVTGAADGRAGLTLARALRPQAILLDVEIPRMDGWSVRHAPRQDPLLADIPVVMVSVKNEQGLAQALGANGYLLKPVDWDRLKRVIERVRPRRDGTVLVVDDDGDARERLRSTLSRDGWTVVEAGDGRQALERLDGVTPSRILPDPMMPVMDGFAFLRRLRQRRDGGLVPVVVLTAKDVTPEQRACLDRQAERIITKGGLGLPDLVQALRDLIPASGR